MAHPYLSQDPYIKLTLHDGEYDQGGVHRGEMVRTKTKNNSGGAATYNETFHVNKPGGHGITFSELKNRTKSNPFSHPENMDCLRVELWDEDTLSDDVKGR